MNIIVDTKMMNFEKRKTKFYNINILLYDPVFLVENNLEGNELLFLFFFNYKQISFLIFAHLLIHPFIFHCG